MSGNKVFVDTNIIIYFLKGHEETKKYFYSYDPYISFISELETLSSPIFLDKELIQIKNFFSDQIVIGYQPEIKDIIIRIRSEKKLKLPDAIIAATAIHLDIPLFSSDKGFKNIPGLKFFYHEPPVI